MKKHTKGPWKISKSVPNVVYCEKYGHEPGICDTQADTIHCLPWEEAEANARLISAAPDLLASCEEMVSILNSYAHNIKNGGDVIAKAVYAIGKATGAKAIREI